MFFQQRVLQVYPYENIYKRTVPTDVFIIIHLSDAQQSEAARWMQENSIHHQDAFVLSSGITGMVSTGQLILGKGFHHYI